jgi:hypothetical protein
LYATVLSCSKAFYSSNLSQHPKQPWRQQCASLHP